MTNKSTKTPYDREIQEAEKLLKELESPLGAEKLGKEAYETAKKDMKNKGLKKIISHPPMSLVSIAIPDSNI